MKDLKIIQNIPLDKVQENLDDNFNFKIMYLLCESETREFIGNKIAHSFIFTLVLVKD